jgi:hypothetical protein
MFLGFYAPLSQQVHQQQLLPCHLQLALHPLDVRVSQRQCF